MTKCAEDVGCVEVVVRHGSDRTGDYDSGCHHQWTAQAVSLIRSHWPHHDDRVLQDLHFTAQPHVLVLWGATNGDSPHQREVIGLGFLACPSTPRAAVLLPRFVRDPTASVEMTFVVVGTRFRGRGIGRRVVEELESVAVQYGYCFAHLVTTNEARFYERLGYRRGRLAQRVYERRCFQTSAFSQQGLNALNHMFQRRRAEAVSGTTRTSALPISSAPPAGTSMHKQLVEEMPRALTRFAARDEPHLSTVEKAVPSSATLRPGKLVWSSVVPWQPQIGPSCGLTLLRMVRDALFPMSSGGVDDASRPIAEWPSLLSLARSTGVTRDGEVLNTSSMSTLSVDYLTACQEEAAAVRKRAQHRTTTPCLQRDVVYEFRSEVRPFNSADDVLRALVIADECKADFTSGRRFLLLPFDRGVSDEEPVGFSGGLRAHWALVSGLLLDTNAGGHPPDESLLSSMSWYAALQHGASDVVSLSPVSKLCESNAQLCRVMLKTVNCDSAGDEPQVEVSLEGLRGTMVLIVATTCEVAHVA